MLVLGEENEQTVQPGPQSNVIVVLVHQAINRNFINSSLGPQKSKHQLGCDSRAKVPAERLLQKKLEKHTEKMEHFASVRLCYYVKPHKGWLVKQSKVLLDAIHRFSNMIWWHIRPHFNRFDQTCIPLFISFFQQYPTPGQGAAEKSDTCSDPQNKAWVWGPEKGLLCAGLCRHLMSSVPLLKTEREGEKMIQP